VRIRRRSSIFVILGLVAAAGLTLTPAPATADTPRPGAVGIGDPLYPGLGNGGYDALAYTLTPHIPAGAPDQPVPSTERMDARATQALSRFNLDFGGPGADAVTSVNVNGRPAVFDWQQDNQELVVTPAQPICNGSVFRVDIAFASHPVVPDPANPYPDGWITTAAGGSFTAFQAAKAHQAFPVNDHPRDKARWTFNLDVPDGVTAVANGRFAGTTEAGGRTTWKYESTDPLATELTQVTVGTDLQSVQRRTTAGITYRDVIPPSQRALVEPLLAQGPAQLRWAVDKIGPFPFPTYGNFVADQLIGYSLETQTMSMSSSLLFTPGFLPGKSGVDSFVLPITQHELIHQYFGDSVSPYSWSDIWLNEGFATYYEKWYAADKGWLDTWGYPSFEAYMRDQYRLGDIMRHDNGPIAQPSPDVDLIDNYAIYDGGAVVLYALKQKVGDRTFTATMRGWARQFAGHSVSTGDFFRYASSVAGRDLTSFLNPWLYDDRTPPMPGHREWVVDPVTDTTIARTHADHPRRHTWGLPA
jgi:aminopeptidase N